MADKQIVIDIKAETTKATNDIKRLNKEIDKLNKQNKQFDKTTGSVNQMSRSFASLATHVGKLAVIYGTFQGLQSTIRTFAEFEQSIKRLGVISGATGEELGLLETEAKRLGETTIFTASQVADGMNSMAMAGLDATQQLDGIAPILDVATIGMLSLEEASLITVTAMNAFGLEAKDIGTITDVMATGVTNSAQTIVQLGNAYEKVGSVATSFGYSMETTTASLELLADAGRRGSEAGTQLKIVMSRLAGNKEAKKYIDELGVSMYDSENKLLPFKDQLVLLKGELGKLDEASRNIKLSEIFGEEGKASAILLMNNLDKFDTKMKQLENSFGSASSKAKEMQDTLMGSYKELRSALEGLAIKIGENLTPIIRDLIDDATLFIQSLSQSDIDAFTKSLSGSIKFLGELGKLFVEIIGFVASLAKDFQDLTGASAGLTVSLATLIYKSRELIPIIFKLSPPILALGVAISAVTYILIKAQRAVDDFNDATNRTATILEPLNKAIDDVAGSTKKWTEQDVRTTMSDLDEGFKNVTKEIKNTQAEIDALNDSDIVTDESVAMVASLERRMWHLNQTLDLTTQAKVKLAIEGKALVAQRRLEIKAINDLRSSENQLALTAERVGKKERTEIDKTVQKLEGREVALEKTLGNMTTKETKFINQLASLEQDLANTRAKFANERETEVANYENKLGDIRAKSLTDLGKYNDAQKRADEQLAKAKEAFAKGDVDMAQQYLDEYTSLIEQSANEEITIKKKVRAYNKETKEWETKEIDSVAVRRSTTLAEYEKDSKAGHDLQMSLITARETKEVEASQAKIESKKFEIEMLQLEMTLQKEMLVLLAEMMAQAKGIEFKPDLTSFNEAMAKTDDELKRLSSEQRDIKLTSDFSQVEQDIDNFEKDIESEPVQVDMSLDLNSSPAEEAIYNIQDLGSEVILAYMEADTSDAEIDIETFYQLGNREVVALQVAKTEYATQVINRFRALAQQPTYSTHYVKTVQTNQLGGLIHAQVPLPKFNTGGHLESGKGHSRKSGKLGGYGGGDKVKALLEAGEFIVRKEAVKSLGLGRLHQINEGQLPKFQAGGFVPPIQHFETGGDVKASSTISASKTVNVNLNVGDQTFPMVSEESVANAFANYLERSTF